MSCLAACITLEDILSIGSTIHVLQEFGKRRRLAAVVADEEVIVGLAINISTCL
jgi:hypothetical protein